MVLAAAGWPWRQENGFHPLTDCAWRGVPVHVLFDALDSTGLDTDTQSRLAGTETRLVFFSPLPMHKLLPNCLRDHSGPWIVDGALAIAGGDRSSDEFIDGKHGRRAEGDLLQNISGPVVSDGKSACLRFASAHDNGFLLATFRARD